MSQGIAKRSSTITTASARAPATRCERAEGPEPTREAIAERAYEIYVINGSKDGTSEENWLQAERELKERGCSNGSQHQACNSDTSK